MTRWTGIVLALSDAGTEEMASRLVTYLHPVAGRPLVWHAASSLAALDPAPERIVVVSGVDLAPGLFHDLPVPAEVLLLRDLDLAHMESHVALDSTAASLVMDAVACPLPEELGALLQAETGRWLATEESSAAAAWIATQRVPELFRLPEPLRVPNGVLADPGRLDSPSGAPVLVVRDRAGLARAAQRVRDRLVRTLMESGVTFLLPESVLVDVDVRIGRDSIVYPGALLEGQTTIGEETVVGPGCRILDSWVGSGVELKGWNYISHTSIRNRAILEPYVRRGFD